MSDVSTWAQLLIGFLAGLVFVLAVIGAKALVDEYRRR
jgi:hypothetical protein